MMPLILANFIPIVACRTYLKATLDIAGMWREMLLEFEPGKEDNFFPCLIFIGTQWKR